MRVAYLLQVHKNPEQVNVLIRQLLAESDADVYVHVDQKSAAAFAGRLPRDPRVVVLGTHLDVSWGDISSVNATLLMLRAALASSRRYEFFTLRSGQDLLVRSGVSDFLTRHRGKSFIEAKHIPRGHKFAAFPDLRWPSQLRRRYESVHPYRLWRSLRIKLFGLGIKPMLNPARLPPRFELYMGSAWFCLCLAHVQYVLDFLDRNPWFQRAFSEALTPDEWFFQTLLMNSPVADELIHRKLVYIRWGQTLRDRNHPLVLTSADISEIESSGEFFARKFDEGVDRSVIEHFATRVRPQIPRARPAPAADAPVPQLQR